MDGYILLFQIFECLFNLGILGSLYTNRQTFAHAQEAYDPSYDECAKQIPINTSYDCDVVTGLQCFEIPDQDN